MTKERMLELLLLEKYEDLSIEKDYVHNNFNYNKFNKRLQELREEFLRPYVMDDALSGE